MYYLQQPATCSKCGHKQPANGTDDAGSPKLDGLTICPKCLGAMFAQFCGVMRPDPAKPMAGDYQSINFGSLITLNDALFNEPADHVDGSGCTCASCRGDGQIAGQSWPANGAVMDSA